MRTLYEAQASILHGGILQRQPETDRRLGLRVQERRVLVGRHLAANARVLVNVHTLRHGWPPEAQLPAHLADAFAARQLPKDVMLGVQRMADLVQRQLGGNEQCTVRVDGVRLEEVAHFVAGLEEVGVPILRPAGGRIGGRKGLAIGMRRVEDELSAGGEQLRAFGGGEEVIDDHVADFVELVAERGLKRITNILYIHTVILIIFSTIPCWAIKSIDKISALSPHSFLRRPCCRIVERDHEFNVCIYKLNTNIKLFRIEIKTSIH